MKARMKDCTSNMFAILHAVGQLHDMGIDVVKTDDIAKMMGVTKPTALKRLSEWHEQGFIGQSIIKHRPNATAYRWYLSVSSREFYTNKRFYNDYHNFITLKIQVSEMKPYNKVFSI